MKNNFKIAKLIFCLIHIFICSGNAQNKEIIFDKFEHNFGTFSEDSEPKVCIFKFTNHGKALLSIAHVQSTCGCAVPYYTHRGIRPGENGEIKITYNPQGRPGHFNRPIIVNFTNQKDKITLMIKGSVTHGVVRKNKLYPYVIDSLQLKTTRITFLPMRGDMQEQNIKVINSGNREIKADFHSSNSNITASLIPAILEPGKTGEIQIIRKTDSNKNRMVCIRIKENTHHPKKAGIIHLLLNIESSERVNK